MATGARALTAATVTTWLARVVTGPVQAALWCLIGTGSAGASWLLLGAAEPGRATLEEGSSDGERRMPTIARGATLAGATLALLLPPAGTPQPPGEVRLAILEGSRIWIEGDSNLHEWACEVGAFEPELRLDRAGRHTPPTRVLAASVSMAVADIDCGNGKMNDNLRKALDARSHAYITFQMTSAQLVDPGIAGAAGALEAMVTGRLTVAGNTRELSLHVSGTDTGDGALRMEGSARIRMSDWGIRPPTAMLGLLTPDDEVTILLDLIGSYPVDPEDAFS